MKCIALLPPLLVLSLPAPEVRLIDVHTTQPEGGLQLQLQVKPQKNVSLAGEVEVASPLVVTDEKGATLETPEVEVLDWNRPVDKIMVLTCTGMPDCDWFRVGGTLRVTQGADTRRGTLHTCPTDKESSFTEGGVTFTVNGEADRALAEQVWNGRLPRIHPESTVCISCDAADACHIKSWELAGRKGMDLRGVHRETKQVDGRFIWFMSYDSVQREVQLRPQIFSTVQTIEVPVDCICGITGQAKEATPLPEGATPGPRIQVESFSWHDDDFPGMGGMVAGSADALTIVLGVDRGQGTPEGCEIKVADATGRHIPCKIHTTSDKIHLFFRETRPEGTWLKIEGTLPFTTSGNSDTTPIRLDGIYTLRGR